MLCKTTLFFVVSAASQNSPNSGWEAKAVEFFKERLKEKDTHTWVMHQREIYTHIYLLLFLHQFLIIYLISYLLNDNKESWTTLSHRQFVLSQVPSLNDVPLHYLKPNSLVKFRCLIQDMFDPEFYMGVYETVDSSTKAKVFRSIYEYFLICVYLIICCYFDISSFFCLRRCVVESTKMWLNVGYVHYRKRP